MLMMPLSLYPVTYWILATSPIEMTERSGQ